MSDAALFALVLENNRMLKALTERMAPKAERDATSAERLVRGQVADRLWALLGVKTPMDPSLDAALAQAEHVIKYGGMAGATMALLQSKARDAALEEAAGLFEGFARDAMAQAPPETRCLARDKMLAHAHSIRALKSKPANDLDKPPTPCPLPECIRYAHGDDLPHIYGMSCSRQAATQPSENPGDFNVSPEPVHDFGWALAQMRAGKKVRRWAWSPMAYVAMNGQGDGFLNHAGGEWAAGSHDILSDKWEVAE